MAGRYDRNPFDEDDVNPFAVSNRCNCCSWVAIAPHSRRDSSTSLVEACVPRLLGCRDGVWLRACEPLRS